eukprot:Gb_03780 [translate_table: standard]
MGSSKENYYCGEDSLNPEKNKIVHDWIDHPLQAEENYFDLPGDVRVQDSKPDSRSGSWKEEERHGFPEDAAYRKETADSKEFPWRMRQAVPISRLPLEKLEGSVTQYDNYLYESEGVEEEEEEEDELDSQSSSVMESPIAKDERTLRVELQRIFALQLRRERCLSGTLVGSSDFFTPRSSVLTPRSSASGTPFHSSSER